MNFLFVSFLFVTSVYFINNYNKFKVYEVKLDSKEYFMDSGVMVVTPNKLLFNFSNIKYNLDIKDDLNVSLYYLDEENKIEIISKFNYDSLYYECVNEYDDLNNFIIEVSYKEDKKNKTVEIPLVLEERIDNKHFIYKKNIVELTEQEERVKVLLENVGYKKMDDNKYVKEYEEDNIIYTYDFEKKVFSYEMIQDDFEKKGIYYVEENFMNFYVIYEDYEIENFTYSNDKIECKLGKCKDSETMINLLLKEYKNLK